MTRAAVAAAPPFEHTLGVFSLRLIKTEGGPRVTLYQVDAARLREKGFACLYEAAAIVSGQTTRTSSNGMSSPFAISTAFIASVPVGGPRG